MLRLDVWRTGLWLGPLVCSLACSESVRLGENLGGSASLPPVSTAGGGAGGAAGDNPLFPPDPSLVPAPPDASLVPANGPCEPVSCGGRPQQCGNCRDDDADGRIDANDPECLGPCDDSEGALFSGIDVRVNGSCRSDCYFDLNSGSGDDGCNWSFRCDPLSRAESDYSPTGLLMCEYDGSLATCQMDATRTSACQTGCLPLTPNGCDCFGCCELPTGSGQFIWLGSQNLDQTHCELATSADPAQCRPCTPVPDCQNDCQECELCVGKPELPASCGGAPACAYGVASCDPREPGACGSLHYCITGCCVPLPR